MDASIVTLIPDLATEVVISLLAFLGFRRMLDVIKEQQKDYKELVMEGQKLSGIRRDLEGELSTLKTLHEQRSN